LKGIQRRSEQKRDRIRRAALDLFKAQGFRKTTIGEIAGQAAVSPVTIYSYFGDKDGLVREVIKFVIDESVARYHALFSSPKPFIERLDQVMFEKSQMLELFSGELARTALGKDPEMRAFVESLWQNQARPLLAEFFEEGRRQGYIRADISFEAFMLYYEVLRRGFYASQDLVARLSASPQLMRELQSIFVYGPVERKGW